MTNEEKVMVLKTMLDISDTSLDDKLTTYLTFAQMEILNWMYNGDIPTEVTAVPSRYENTQIMSVVTGFNHEGAEGEIVHNENGINRTFVYEDMINYIRQNVFQIISVG